MIHPRYYGDIFLYIIVALTLFVASQFTNKSFAEIRRAPNSGLSALFVTFLFALWLGLRPSLYGYSYFGDSALYYHTYGLLQGALSGRIVEKSELLWTEFSRFCAQNTSVEIYFTIISLGYFTFSYLACKVLAKNNILCLLVALMGTISFYSYAVNGIRNGLACSIILYAIALLVVSRKNLITSIILSIIAVNIHRTAILPIACLLVSIYYIKSFKTAYTFWILAAVVSLLVGNAISNFFIGLGFDDRMTTYGASDNDGYYTKVGFRWDFLIYSMMPIVLGYYIIIKRGIRDRSYELLLNTYTLANAFWVMVIRASYSNRFAYLSWFMYAIVLIYPLLKLDIWGEQQGKYLKQILLAHIGFTWFMETFYW